MISEHESKPFKNRRQTRLVPFERLAKSSTTLTKYLRSIASAVEEQSITTKQISENVLHTASAAETVASGVSETTLASRDITDSFAKVDSILSASAIGAEESLESARELSMLAKEMSQLVGRFKCVKGPYCKNGTIVTTCQSRISQYPLH